MAKILFITLFYLLIFPACSTFYVIKQGIYQLQLVTGAQKIEQALRAPDLDKVFRKKLMLIQEVREFCQHNLYLKADKNYKNVNLSWDKTVHNVSASDKTNFKPYTWWFPIIGAVPYKGYFDEQDAAREEERLKNLHLDTIKRTVGGYSTLGYFDDPVWPSMLKMNDESLVELIIHELAHATLYIPNQTPFNESFASFVGETGARLFFAHKYGSDSQELKKIIKYQTSNKIFNDFFSQIYDRLDNIYNSGEQLGDKITLKDEALKKAEIEYHEMAIKNDFRGMDWRQVNNAYLLSFKRYNFDDAIFSELFAKSQGNFRSFLNEISSHAQPKEPFQTLRAYLDHAKENS